MAADKDPFAQAQDSLRKRYEERMSNLIDEQEKSREKRAWEQARSEQDRPNAPRPTGGPKEQAPDLVMLVRKHERQLRDADQRQRDALTKEYEGEVQRLKEMQRDGQGQGMGANELAAAAIKPREQNAQREQPFKTPGDEFNRQAPRARDLDKGRVDIEHKAAQERAIAAALGGQGGGKAPARERDQGFEPER